jgi:hypothetical protein
MVALPFQARQTGGPTHTQDRTCESRVSLRLPNPYRPGVGFGRAPPGNTVLGLMTAGAVARLLAGTRVGAMTGLGAGFGAGAGSRGAVGFGAAGASRAGALSRRGAAWVGFAAGRGALAPPGRPAAGTGVGEGRMSSGGRNETGSPPPWITTAIVASGVGCGMKVGGTSSLLMLARVQPAVAMTASTIAAPSHLSLGLGLPVNRIMPTATYPSHAATGVLLDRHGCSSIQKIDVTHQQTNARYTLERVRRCRSSQIAVKL